MNQPNDNLTEGGSLLNNHLEHDSRQMAVFETPEAKQTTWACEQKEILHI